MLGNPLLEDPENEASDAGKAPFVRLDQRTIGQMLRIAVEERKRDQLFRLVRFLVAVAVFVFLVVFLVDKDKSLLGEIVKIAGGVGIGYGLRSKRNTK